MPENQSEEKHTINLRREDLGNCRGCGASSEGEQFKGHADRVCTHMNSEGGWWLRIDHKYEIDGVRKSDVVGELLCPKCLAEHNKRMAEFIDGL